MKAHWGIPKNVIYSWSLNDKAKKETISSFDLARNKLY